MILLHFTSSNLRNVLRSSYLKVDRTLKQLFRLFFRFPQTLATRKINAFTLAQKRTAMTNTERESNKSANKTKSILIGVLLVGFGYFFGGLTYYKQLFPFEQIRSVKNIFFGGSLQQANEPKPRNTLFQTFSPTANVVMIGDSITEGGVWDEIFTETRVSNRGIGGDRADDILLRMEPIFAVNAKKAFVMVGINDIYSGQSIEYIFTNYKNIVQQLKNKGTAVYIQSTLECSINKCGNKLDKVRELNTKLKSYAAEQKIPFIDINVGLTSEKQGLLSDYSLDGVHLLGKGYLKWSQTISPYVYSN